MIDLNLEAFDCKQSNPFDYDIFIINDTDYIMTVVQNSTITFYSFSEETKYLDSDDLIFENNKKDKVQDIFLCCALKRIKKTLFLLIGCESGTVLCLDYVTMKLQIIQEHRGSIIQISSIKNSPDFLTLGSDHIIYENHLKITKSISKKKFIDQKNILKKINRIDCNEDYLLCAQENSNMILVDMFTNEEIMRISNVFKFGISDIKFFNKKSIIALSTDGNFGTFQIDFNVIQKAKLNYSNCVL